MEQEQIYVLVPAYNAEKFIGAMFDSLIAQTYTNWTCLCLNDGSSDNTLDVIKTYAAQDSRIQWWTQSNKGVAKTLNTLLDKVPENAEYISFLDSDDVYHPLFLAYLHKALKTYGADISECLIERLDETKKALFAAKPALQEIKQIVIDDMSIYFVKHEGGFLGDKWINKVNKLYVWRKIKDFRFDEKLAYEEDYFYAVQVHTALSKKVVLLENFYYWRINSHSATHAVKWDVYLDSALRRCLLSNDYFLKENRVPPAKRNAFIRDLARDAFRMIVKKPLRRSKTNQEELFLKAQAGMKRLFAENAFSYKDFALYNRFILWLLFHGKKGWLKLALKLK